ncbi:RNI-like protein [Didymella exigua CBS 183.55]|uniref:RNI-like protein n=1 Tax=Didymella exigua CBS 183.55 TaxID=1150837 RepID=A0A6A5RIH5_9PLEO|nr:RNI-like protein [Didymella exigua CBS 183.55]KAF1927622.1 RNI-like protein [Didymella exigua CBS 183.55]
MTAVQPSREQMSAMEDIHGVDVSWLHNSTRDHHHRTQAPSSPGLTRDAPPKTSSHGGLPTGPQQSHGEPAAPTPAKAPAVQRPASPPAPAPASSATSTPQKIPPKRPTMLSRGSDVRNGGTTPPDSKASSRRNSWISSISSKFSSQNPTAQTTHTQAQGSPAAANGAHGHAPSANGALNGIQQAAGGSPGLEPYVPQAPKANFLSNALRRLSSGTQVGTAGKLYPNGGMCPRRVMNVDKNRQRCLVPELDQNKLRKVAFCVDVEIAGGPKYKDDLDKDDRKKKAKDTKVKERGEGEALKHPTAVVEAKETAGVVAAAQEAVGTEQEPHPEGTVLDDDQQEPNKKKEKKKRSEAERKERKEKKRKKAEENGSIPMELIRDEGDLSADGRCAAPGTSTPPRPQDRPTIDPLRIYRRCCQLRESPILKRISDQLSSLSACSVAHPGMVTSLDLTGSRLQLADVLTLSDWLAIVPVKKLLLEDADLNDEKIRVILAGLLAAKMPPTPRHSSDEEPSDTHGCAIKKLVLKNNAKVGAEGWKHIALFTYMCKSVTALDVSMIPFPKQPTQVPSQSAASPPANGTPLTSPAKDTKTRDVAEILSKAISERLGGSTMQELLMADCGLTSPSTRKIIDGCIISGVKRLSLADNDIDREGLEHVQHYIRSGVCEGIDLGGNDLREWIPQLCQSLGKDNMVWALCLANTGLTKDHLKMLFPVLVNLPSLRFLDLSRNMDLFDQTALCLLRKYIPQFKELKRLHLQNVGLKPADAIAIAEILPDCPHIAHIDLLDNPAIALVATSTDEETQEEAAAMFASLTLAAKLSRTLICVDIDVPSPEMNEVVRALAKQVVAYCLRNIESINEVPELGGVPREVELPGVLAHLVGPNDDSDADGTIQTAPDNDYIVGGTGIVKALSYCLSHKDADLRRGSQIASGTVTPRSRADVVEEPSRARVMSKNLLDTARNTRSRIQPALIREAKGGNDLNYRRLLFLDQTLEGMIQRFEDEYPETRLGASPSSTSLHSRASSVLSTSPPLSSVPTMTDSFVDPLAQESDEDEPRLLRSRHNSDVSLASRSMAIEEGALHRFGHRVRTGLLNSSRPSSSHSDQALLSGTFDNEGLPEHLRALREYFTNFSGDELRTKIQGLGWEKAFDSVLENAQELKNLESEDPVVFQRFRESQIASLKNRNPDLQVADVIENGRGDGVNGADGANANAEGHRPMVFRDVSKDSRGNEYAVE